MPLVGRTDEVQLLLAFLDAVVAGEPRPLLLQGEAGIGKSRLAATCATETAQRDLSVLSIVATEYDRQRPFACLQRALRLDASAADARRATLSGLLHDSGPPDVAALHHRLVDGIVDLLHDEADVVIAEDLHWMDAASAVTLLRFVTDERPTALLATRREFPTSPEVDRLTAAIESTGTVVGLAPLSPSDVASLASTVLGTDPSPTLMDALGRAGGNPLFVTELLDSSDGDVHQLPPTLHLAIVRRLGALDESTADVLRMAAVLGSRFNVADLATVLDQAPSALVGPLRQAVDAGLLNDAGVDLKFRHDLIRDAVYDEVPHGVRAALHVQIGRRLAEAGAPAAVVAPHFGLGARPGDEEAVAWLRRAAADAAPRDPATAAFLLDKSLRLCPLTAPYRDSLTVELIRSAVWSGRFDTAEQWAEKVLHREHDAAVGAEVRYYLARVQIYRGRIAESIATVEAALARPGVPPRLRARLLADLALRHGAAGDLNALVSRAEQAQDAARDAGDALALSTGFSALAWRDALSAQPATALEHAAVALRTGVEEEAVQPVQARLYAGYTEIAADDLAAAATTLSDARRLAGELGATWGQPLASTFLAAQQYAAGAWDAAAATADEALRLAEETAVGIGAPIAAHLRASVAVHAGEIEAARALAEPALHEVQAGIGARLALPWLLLVKANVQRAGGDEAGAAELLFAAWDEAEAMGLRRDLLDMGIEVALAAWRCEDRGRLHHISESVLAIASNAQLPGAGALAALCAALDRQDSAAAVTAAGAMSDHPRPLLRAQAAEAALELCAAAGTSGPRARLADAALATYEELGAAWDADRVQARRRSLGLRRSRATGTARRSSSGWDALTRTEQRVVRLVAQGLTNGDIAARLYISRRTVETHVSHALAKLEVASRMEIVALVPSLDPDAAKSP